MAYSKSSSKAVTKYISKTYDQVVIRLAKGDREKYKDLAARRGQSLNALVVSLLEKEMQLCPPPQEKE